MFEVYFAKRVSAVMSKVSMGIKCSSCLFFPIFYRLYKLGVMYKEEIPWRKLACIFPGMHPFYLSKKIRTFLKTVFKKDRKRTWRGKFLISSFHSIQPVQEKMYLSSNRFWSLFF